MIMRGIDSRCRKYTEEFEVVKVAKGRNACTDVAL